MFIHAIISGVASMERKEGIVVSAAAALVVYTLVLILIGPFASAAIRNFKVSNSGSVTTIGVGVYWDQACTNPVSSIAWGTLDPGATVERTVFVRNEGNTDSSISLTTSNWSPSNASDYITLNWDYSGQTLSVNQVVQVKFTLSVSSSISGITNFSFDITISTNAQ